MHTEPILLEIIITLRDKNSTYVVICKREKIIYMKVMDST